MAQHEFEWNGDHPILDFVNTLDERFSDESSERLPHYAALLEFMRQAELLDGELVNTLQTNDNSAAEKVWRSAIRLRETLFLLLEALKAGKQPATGLLTELDTQVKAAFMARRVIADETGLSWKWLKPEAAERPLWELALAAEKLLVSDDTLRIKQCAADDCAVFFLDKSRARTRRWCSMTSCGNRNKVRRFRSEQ